MLQRERFRVAASAGISWINLVDLALDWAERDHDALREARAGTELHRWQRAPAVTSQ
ncbi:MAG: hypothetical protein Q8S33_30930 [Myxococcales bacterium]|nr:hypothetical protein [Myxococcales bacterium]